MSDMINKNDLLGNINDNWYARVPVEGHGDQEEADFWSRMFSYIEQFPTDENAVSRKELLDRINEERKKARGRWHTDRYWLGWSDAMRRAGKVIDGTIDEPDYYAPSGKREFANGCDGCAYSPPGSTDGKPCSQCNPHDPVTSCFKQIED